MEFYMFTLLELVLIVVVAGFVISTLYKKLYSSRVEAIKQRYENELAQQRKHFEQEQHTQKQNYTNHEVEREVDFFKQPTKKE